MPCLVSCFVLWGCMERKCYGMSYVCSGKSRIFNMENKEARKRCDKQAFPGFVEGWIIILPDFKYSGRRVHLTVQQLQVSCGFQVR